MTLESIHNITVSRADIATLTGYSEKYINELVREQGAPCTGHDQYPLLSFLLWWVEYLKALHEKQIQVARSEKPSEDLARKNAHLKQLDIDEREGRLLLTDHVEKKILDLLGIMKNALNGQGARMSIRLEDLKAPEIKRLLDEDNNKTLEQIADTADTK